MVRYMKLIAFKVTNEKVTTSIEQIDEFEVNLEKKFFKVIWEAEILVNNEAWRLSE